MQKIMMMLLAVTALVSGIGCSSTKILRTKSTDAQLRVFIDPKIPTEHYVQIRRAMVRTGKFEVVDRNEGFEAAIREQELQHGLKGRRFNDLEKWSWVGEFYGAAAVVTAHPQCFNRFDFWGKYVKTCKQEIALINTSNGRVELAIGGENSEPVVVGYSVPDWNDVVERMAEEYPEYFEARIVEPILENYMEQSKERSKREREHNLRGQAQQTRFSLEDK